METPSPTSPTSPLGAAITPALAEFLESGLIMYLGTRSAGLQPASVGAAGLRVETPTTVTVFVAEAVMMAALDNLQDNGQMSVELVKVSDARAVQIKGRLVSMAPATDADAAFQEAYRARLMPELSQVGMPRSTIARLVFTPSRALRMNVDALFLQTPGPHAGRPLEADGASILRRSPGTGGRA